MTRRTRHQGARRDHVNADRARPGRGRARAAGLGVLAAASFALASCAPALPEPNPPAEPSEPLPVVTVDQADDVLADVGAALAEGDEARNPQLLSPRVADPALTLRTAQYTLAERSDGERAPTPIGTEDQVLAIGAANEWPRLVMAVTAPAEGATTPLLLVLQQDDARGAYRLVSWSRLFPGVETPAVAGPEAGSPQLPPDAEGLLATPAETLARYADVLAKGGESEFAELFTENPYVQQLQQELESARTGLEGIAEVSLSAAAVPAGLVALETADGGALVVGVVETTTDYIKRLGGSTLTLGGEAGQWLGDGEVSSRANVRHDSMVAFYVPPADGGEDQITTLGADRVLVAATKA